MFLIHIPDFQFEALPAKAPRPGWAPDGSRRLELSQYHELLASFSR